jgi:hypothetical protein
MSTSDDGRSDRGPGIIAAAIVAAALILSWGRSNNEPRYQLASSGDSVVRMDRDSGELIACNVKGCNRIEAPDRAKTFGPVTFEIGDDAEKKAPPLPANGS